MVIYIAGEVGGSVGPLPYGIEECQRRASVQMSLLDKTVVTPEGITQADIQFKCEWLTKHPTQKYK